MRVEREDNGWIDLESFKVTHICLDPRGILLSDGDIVKLVTYEMLIKEYSSCLSKEQKSILSILIKSEIDNVLLRD